MAIHEVFSSDDVNPHRATEDNAHDVTGQHKHLTATDGTKGASVSQPLSHLANKQHDDSGHFSAHYSAQEPGHDKAGQDDPPKMGLQSAMREVHTNVPKNVMKTGKTGKAKEAMLQAIAYSKAKE